MTDSLRPSFSRRAVLTGVVALPAAIALGGCIGTNRPPEPRRFYLMPLTTVSGNLPRVAWSLAVDPPETPPALNTDRIALLFSENEFDYYADAAWGDDAPIMVQQLIIRSFQKSGRIGVVVNERERVRGDFRLTSFLSPFFAVGPKGAAPEARVGLEAQLIRSRGRETVGTRTISHAVQSSGADIATIVAAFNTAMHQVLEDLVAWTITTGSAAAA
jgi:cholesterol transport system auxiliary component